MFPFISILLISLDQISKYLFGHFFSTQKIHLIGDFLTLSFVKNSGIAFSLPLEGIILKVLTIVLIGAISLYFFRYEPYKNLPITRWAYTLILS